MSNNTHWLRPLGDTDLTVSALGLGTVKFGRNQSMKYPAHFELPDDDTIRNLLAMARDHGINLIDTAPAYGSSETRLGELLTGPRTDWIIASKAGEQFDGQQSSFDFSPEHIRHSVHNSLKRLKTDYLDILLIHSDGNDQKIIEEDGVFDTLNTLKQAGLIRAGGMSTKTVAGGLKTLAQSDIAMVTYYPGYTDEVSVLDAAAQHQKGIFIKKGLASGHLEHESDSADPITTAMQFVLGHPGVSSLITGTINPQHLAHNIAAARSVLDSSDIPMD